MKMSVTASGPMYHEVPLVAYRRWQLAGSDQNERKLSEIVLNIRAVILPLGIKAAQMSNFMQCKSLVSWMEVLAGLFTTLVETVISARLKNMKLNINNCFVDSLEVLYRYPCCPEDESNAL